MQQIVALVAEMIMKPLVCEAATQRQEPSIFLCCLSGFSFGRLGGWGFLFFIEPWSPSRAYRPYLVDKRRVWQQYGGEPVEPRWWVGANDHCARSFGAGQRHARGQVL